MRGMSDRYGDTLTFYHGSTSPSAVERAEEAAPEWRHGFMWTPEKMTAHDRPYALDNGAFGAFNRGEPFPIQAFLDILEDLDSMPRNPDFVVAPDVVGEPISSQELRDRGSWIFHLAERDLPVMLPIQDGQDPVTAVEQAARLHQRGFTNVMGIFIGGSREYKRRVTKETVRVAHNNALFVHLARPSIEGGAGRGTVRDGIQFGLEAGVDSMDTTSIVANKGYDMLREIASQPRLSGF